MMALVRWGISDLGLVIASAASMPCRHHRIDWGLGALPGALRGWRAAQANSQSDLGSCSPRGVSVMSLDEIGGWWGLNRPIVAAFLSVDEWIECFEMLLMLALTSLLVR